LCGAARFLGAVGGQIKHQRAQGRPWPMAGGHAGAYMAVRWTGGRAMRRCIAAAGIAVVGLFALMAVALVVPLGAGPAWGRPMDGALQQQLLSVYHG